MRVCKKPNASRSPSPYLNDGDAQERAAEADGGGRGGHDGGAEEEADCHGDGRDGVPAGDDLGLQGHEEPCAAAQELLQDMDRQHYTLKQAGCIGKEKNSPKLNMAMPSPASESIVMEFFTMAGIAKWNLQTMQHLCRHTGFGLLHFLFNLF
jgi:hypothetical protein